MSIDQQIEEMAKVIFSARDSGDIPYDIIKSISSDLYRADYRKAADVAEEIFAEIIDALSDEQIKESQKANSALEAQDTQIYEIFSYAEDKISTIVLALSIYKNKYTKGKS